ncbi:MAG: PAS domain-containing sensor histidine kinase [Ignavibacteriales bacterium]|nr:PAS domain-containing sensor histidine kinase [Ignavibacteriales bacterium]
MSVEPEKSLNPINPKPALLVMLEVNEEKGTKIVYSEGKTARDAEKIILVMGDTVKTYQALEALAEKIKTELKYSTASINPVEDLQTPGAAFYEVEFTLIGSGQVKKGKQEPKTESVIVSTPLPAAPQINFSNTVYFVLDLIAGKITTRSGDLTALFSGLGIEPDMRIIPLLKRIHPADIRLFNGRYREALAGSQVEFNYRIYTDDQQLKYIRHFVQPVFTDDKLVSLQNLIIDVTDDKELVQRLRRSEEKLRILFETADDLIFVLDQRGNFSSVNALGALSLEYLPEEMTGKHFISFIEDDQRSIIAVSFKELLKISKLVTFEAAFITKFGKKLTFEINARPVYTQKNRFDGIVGIGRNVTSRIHDQEMMSDLNNKLIEANRIISIERDRVKQRISVLEELNHLKSEFVANISHELRTPLASIIGFSETIDSDSDMPESVRKDFNKIILTEAKRLAELINDVLDISKLEGGKVILNRSDFDPIDVLNEAVGNIRKYAEEKSITIIEEYPDTNVIINADKDRTLQVFENILSNAVKFTGPGGRITIFARLRKNELEVIISDTGIGIPKKDLPHIFQKFYRVSRSDNSIPGSGLGLALVKQIIDLHKGFITLKSEENNGTTVIMKLQLIPKRYTNHG